MNQWDDTNKVGKGKGLGGDILFESLAFKEIYEEKRYKCVTGIITRKAQRYKVIRGALQKVLFLVTACNGISYG